MSDNLPGVYGEERAPAVPTMQNTIPLRGALIGKFESGDVDEFNLVDAVGLVTDYGGLLPGSAAYHAAHFLEQGSRQLHICRVQGTAASISLGVNCGTATARVDGTWANGAGTSEEPTAGVILKVEDGTVAETKKVSVIWACPRKDTVEIKTEVYDNLVVAEPARNIQTYINARSALIRISGDPSALPANEDFLLAAGAAADYDAAIAALDTIRGNLAIFTDTQDADVGTALATAINTRSGTYPDITADASIGILSAAQYATVETITTLVGTVNDPRFGVAGTWKHHYDPVWNASRAFCEAPVLAGIRCRLRPEHSWTNKRAYGITGTERALTRADHVTLMEAGVSTIDLWLDDTTRGWRVISGVASDGSQLYVRVAKDWVTATELSNSAWAVGELQGEADPDPLRVSLKAQSDTYWGDKVLQRRCERKLIKCDAENNLPTDVANGICTKDVEVKLYRVADVIRIRIAAGTESVIAREVA